MMLVTVGPYANFNGHMYKLQTTFWIYQKNRFSLFVKLNLVFTIFLKLTINQI